MKTEHSRSWYLKRSINYSWKYLLLVVVLVVVLGPFVWMVSGSLKTNNDVLAFPPSLIPQHWEWSNYAEVFRYQPFAPQLLNSVIVMVIVSAATVCLSTFAGYGLAKLRVPGASIIFVILLTGIFIPAEATIVPLYRMAASLGWTDTLLPLIVFTSFITTAPIATFVMRQAFLTLPDEYGEAARVDGAGRWRTLIQVYFPMARPSVASVVVLSAFYSWNQFLEPLIFLRTSTNYTATLGISHYEDPYAGPLWGVQLAAATLSVIPVLVVFFLAQRHVVAGLTAGGLK